VVKILKKFGLTNAAFCWFMLCNYITMHSAKKRKVENYSVTFVEYNIIFWTPVTAYHIFITFYEAEIQTANSSDVK